MNENRHDKMPSHNIDDLFRSAIDPLDDAPSSSVWQNLEKDLDRSNILNIKKKYNNLKRVAIAAVLILSSALLYEYQTQHGTSTNEIAVTKTMKNSREGNMNVENEVNKSVDVKAASKDGLQKSNNDLKPDIKKDVAGTGAIAADKLTSVEQDMQKFSQQHSKVPEEINNRPWLFNKSYAAQRNNLKTGTSFGLNDLHSLENYGSAANFDLPSKVPSPVDLLIPVNGSTERHNIVVDPSNYSQSLVVNKVAGSEKLASQTVKLSKRHSSFSLSVIFSPDFTSRLVKADWPINREDNRDEIRKSERYAFSYSIGALADYKISKHWGIQSGFALSRAVINIDPKFIFARHDDFGDVKYKFNSSSGYSYLTPHSISRPAFGDSLHAFGSTSSLLYLSIPVAVKYKIASKKLDYFASAGIAANMLIKDKIETSLFSGGNPENAVDRNIKGLKPVYYTALVAAGASYNINKTVAVSFSPTVRLALTSINQDAPVKSYQQSLGLVAGVEINF